MLESRAMQNDDSDAVRIRPAVYEDARPVYRLIREHSDALLLRPLSNVLENLDRFLVAEAPDGAVVGAICYGLWPEIGNELRTNGSQAHVALSFRFRAEAEAEDVEPVGDFTPLFSS